MDAKKIKRRVSIVFITLSTILTAIPIFSVILSIITNMVNVPFWDQWNWVSLFGNFFSGSLTVTDIWEPYSEHIIVLPRLIMLALAFFTNWDVRYELLVNVVLATIIFLLFIKIIQRTFAPYSIIFTILLPSISLIIFSLTQYENWIVGGDMMIFLCVAFVTFGIYILTIESQSTTKFVIALFAGIAASISFGTGLAYWFVGAWIITQWRKPWQDKIRFLLSWIVISIVIFGVFFYETLGTKINSVNNILSNPISFIGYILIYIGRPVTAFTLSHIDIMIIGGILGLVSFIIPVFWLWQSESKIRSSLVPYIAFGFFSLINAPITGFSRFHFGLTQAGSSRYTSVTNLLWIAILILYINVGLYGYRRFRKFNKQLASIISLCTWCLFTFVILLLVVSSLRSVREFESFHNRFVIGRDKMLSGEVCVNELIIHGNRPCEPEKINILKKYRLSTFTD